MSTNPTPIPAQEFAMRELLAEVITRRKGIMVDESAHPVIDFRTDSAETIKRKLHHRKRLSFKGSKQ